GGTGLLDGDEETTVLVDDAAATQVTEAPPLPLAPRRRRLPVVPIAVVGALLLALVLLIGYTSGSGPGPATPATTAPTEAPTPVAAPPPTTPTVTRTQAPRPRKGHRKND